MGPYEVSISCARELYTWNISTFVLVRDASRYRKTYSFMRQEKRLVTALDSHDQLKEHDEVRFRKSYGYYRGAPRLVRFTGVGLLLTENDELLVTEDDVSLEV